MSKLIVQNNGPLYGEVIISGAKNAVLPLMAATLLSSKTCLIDDVPDLKDVSVMKDMLMSFGAEINSDNKEELEVKVENISTTNGDYELVKKMRASFLVMGPLLSRCGRAYMPLPGGCAIGKRPIDLHLKGFKALGAEVTEGDFFVEAKAGPGGLIGASIYLDFPSVGATENIMMAAVLAKGTTYIENAAEEPEIVDLANFLNKMGARIKGAGTDTIKIEGVTELRGVTHTVIPDRIETGTFMLAAAITRGEVLIKNIVPDHVKPIVAKLKECGVTVELLDDGMYVDARDRVLTATNIKTLPYPGFPTDIQSPFMAFLTTVKGSSEVMETVFENRFMHVNELNRMGANIKTEDRIAFVPGDSELEGTQVVATDLRAGAALVLAGLFAKETTEISQIYHIERGYEKFVEKFRKLGATIIKVEE
ncbi:MAG: UDP-N-acetylglucosamine 1-carboxyvinyltransferase [Clostridiales bacterium]|nr:UDP-N-acetylglucosamine 1-carboxyvinyltransferase [Clostridiales bacterium]